MAPIGVTRQGKEVIPVPNGVDTGRFSVAHTYRIIGIRRMLVFELYTHTKSWHNDIPLRSHL
jgi:hypothetical protein